MDYSSPGVPRSPFSPRVRQSISGRRPIGLSSAKKNQNKFMQSAEAQGGDVIYKTPMTTIETFGAPLPVMVTEALTFASGEVTVRMSSSGWCWAVAGRRVLAWERASAQPARELVLPQTDLAHKADLVVLFYEDGPMPACVGISPEGVIRYWGSVGQEGAYSDVPCELGGQECERLVRRRAGGLLLATTTCTLVRIDTCKEGRPTVVCQTLRPPSGWLGGIGRRVSLLFFGSMPAHETKLVGVVVLPGGEGGEGGEGEGGEGGGVEGEECVALVAGGPLLQLWRGADLHEHHLRRPLAEAFARAHLAPQGDLNSLEVAALDVRASGPGSLLLLLAAGHAPPPGHAPPGHAPPPGPAPPPPGVPGVLGPARPPDVRYALAYVCVESPERPRVTRLVALRAPRDDAPPRLLPLPPPAARALLYTHTYVALVSAGEGAVGAAGAAGGAGGADKAEYLDVAAEGDRLLGAALCGGAPLLFSAKHGVLRLRLRTSELADHPDLTDHPDHHTSLCDSPMGSPCPSDVYDGNLSLYEIDPNEVSAMSTDVVGKLKAAFLFHVRRQGAAAAALLAEAFPAPPSPGPAPPAPPAARDVDAPLDRAVRAVATEMLDDVPAGDPRWKTGGGVALGSSAALQAGAQLRDKQRAFSLFLDFLRAHQLWRRLGLLSRESGDGVVSTWHVLGALAEQLAAARALQRVPRAVQHVLDAALHQVAHGAEDEDGEAEDPAVSAALAAGALAPHDVVFRRAARAARVLRALARAAPPADARAAAAHQTATIDIVNSVMGEMLKVRAQWAQWAQWAAPAARPPPDLAPRALLPALVALHKRAVSVVAHACGEAGARAALLAAAAALADLLLAELEPLRRANQHAYERIRRDLIQPYVDEGQTERAAVLAEKFRDFELLIEMCVRRRDLERLCRYIDTYIDEGVAEQTFAWLASRGGVHVAQLVRALGARGGVLGARLARWLAAPARAPLAALHALHAGQPAPAASALLQLAEEETQSVARMTTMASMAKLCLLAAEGEPQQPQPQEPQPQPQPQSQGELWRRAELRLALAEQHAALPRDLRTRHGLDQHMRVMDPEELIHMYIESESKSLSEYDFKKALDLTDFIADMERRDELRLRIWCACIRADDWAGGAGGAGERPADALRDKMFFRLVELVQLMGGDLELVLPPLEDVLTARELAELVTAPRAHFLLKYGYECLAAAP